MKEARTAGLAADRLRAAGYEVTAGVGKTGIVGLLRNSDGPTVMLRADMDALPIQEATDLPYSSIATATDRAGNTVPVSTCAATTCMSRGSRRRSESQSVR
jgi:hippurate hydrolase